MNTSATIRWACGFLFAAFLASAQTTPAPPGQTLDPLARQRPRFFSTNGFEFAVYQPQITA
jgi:hypothetical protein